MLHFHPQTTCSKERDENWKGHTEKRESSAKIVRCSFISQKISNDERDP